MRRYTPSAYSPKKRKERIDYLKKVLFLCLFAFLTTAMLLENEKALALSLTGLNLWFQKMIPAVQAHIPVIRFLHLCTGDRFPVRFSHGCPCDGGKLPERKAFTKGSRTDAGLLQ